MSSLTLVTGATGFVGGCVVDALLARGQRVRVLARDPARVPMRWAGRVDVVSQDLARASSLAGACLDVETVLHLAGYAHAEDEGSERSSDLHQAITVEGTRRLIAAAAEHRVTQMVFLSSVKAMGECTAGVSDERTQPAPSTAYGQAKLQAELLVLGAGRPAGVVVRSPLVYGPHAKGNLQRMIEAIGARRFPPVPHVPNRRSMIDVRDLAGALLLVSRVPAAKGRVLIATDGESYSTRRLYEAICVALKRPAGRLSVPISLLRAGGKIGDAVTRLTGKRQPLSTERLAKLFGDADYSNHALVALGFRPAFRFETALPDMIAAASPSEGA